MSKLSLTLVAVALTSQVSCFFPAPVPPPPQRPAYGPDYDISPPPPPSQPAPSAFTDSGLTQPPAPQPPPTANGNFPTATRTEKPDQVLSPYEPYNVIDVAGFKSGQLARDPSNQKIFRVP